MYLELNYKKMKKFHQIQRLFQKNIISLQIESKSSVLLYPCYPKLEKFQNISKRVSNERSSQGGFSYLHILGDSQDLGEWII